MAFGRLLGRSGQCWQMPSQLAGPQLAPFKYRLRSRGHLLHKEHHAKLPARTWKLEITRIVQNTEITQTPGMLPESQITACPRDGYEQCGLKHPRTTLTTHEVNDFFIHIQIQGTEIPV